MKLDKYIDKIYNCSRCGICRHWGWNGVEDVCPIYKHTTKYETEYTRGRVKTARLLAEDQVEPSDLMTKHILECTLCGRCEACCPCDIPIHEAFQAMRSDLADKGFTLPAYEKTAQTIAEEKNPYGAGEAPAKREKNPLAKVLYYPGCTINRRAPEVRDEIESVFKKLGVEYDLFTEDTCCGFPLYDIGMEDKMKDVAAETLKLIDAYKPDIVVTSCPGCLNAIGHFWKEKLGLAHDYLVVDISEFLLPKLQDKELKAHDERVTWHDPCVLGRHLGEYDTPREVLNGIPGIDFVEMAEHHEKSACCGAGGGVMNGFGKLARQVGADRVDQALDVKATEMYTSCPSCYVNLKRATGKRPVKVRYITGLVDDSL